MVAKTRSLHTVLGAGGAGRQFMMRHFASPAKRNHHAPAVSGTSFVRPFAACSVPSSSPLYQSPCDYYDRTVNVNTSSVSGTAGILSCPRRLVSSSTPGASPPSETQAQYFEGPWHEKYWLLGEYKNKHGNCLVPKSYAIGDVRLGDWVDKQRGFCKKNKLSADRREMLNALGFSWDPLADRWERNFALLEQYKGREGHSDVPHGYEEDGAKLGRWVCWLRQQYKKGKLAYSYQRRLDNLGMSWDPLTEQWERSFAVLEQYKGREGHCDVPQKYEESEVFLGAWIDTQRQLYKKGKLDEFYQRRLENLGVIWDPLADQWERNFALLKQFIEREGHCNVPRSHEEDGVKLGEWISRQRQVRKGSVGGTLGAERIERLDNLGIRWSFTELNADQWERNFGMFQQYKKREGHCDVPISHEEDGIKLGSWLARQRQVRKGKHGILGADRIERLNKLGTRWSFK